MRTPPESPIAPVLERNSFDAERLELIQRLEHEHFWFTGRRRLVERLLERHVGRVGAAVDVGSGTGSLLSLLDHHAAEVVGIDPLAGAGRVSVGAAERLPFADESIDLVTALDVLEHVDDRAAVVEFARVLRPRGWVILTVPAFPSLWSERDQRAAHLRRYRRGGLTALLGEASFDVVETAYYQFALFPALVASRIAARFRPAAVVREEDVPPGLNWTLRRINELEVRLGAWLRWPFGSTLAVVARKVPG
jgi:SAM-dependent methyltransferase